MKDDKKNGNDDKSDKNVPVELSTLVATEVVKMDLLTGYKFVKNEMVYNEEWKKLAKVNKCKKEKSKIEKKFVETSEMNIAMIDKYELDALDHFQNCE